MLISICAFALTLLAAQLGLPLLKKNHMEARVRLDGPQSHLKKSGTPLMGGLFILFSLLACSFILAYRAETNRVYWALVLLILASAAIGLVDDWIKTKVRRDGFTVLQKTALLLGIMLLFILWFFYGADGAQIVWPGAKDAWVLTGAAKFVYTVFSLLALFYISNSVNITDGVDGLCSSVSLLVFASLAAIAWKVQALSSSYGSAGRLAGILAAACLAFLLYNRHPARVFLGDTGSLALGSAFGGLCLLLHRPWLLFLPGLLYILEGLSTLLQVAYFKLTHGQRLFRMAPLHHHFELGGWSENRIVLSFALFTLLTSALAYFIV